MTRPLPRCATCGAPLARRGRVLVQYRDLPGGPTVGWCIEHPDYSAVTPPAPDDGQHSESAERSMLLGLLGRIEAAGEGRLVAGPAWRRARLTHRPTGHNRPRRAPA